MIFSLQKVFDTFEVDDVMKASKGKKAPLCEFLQKGREEFHAFFSQVEMFSRIITFG